MERLLQSLANLGYRRMAYIGLFDRRAQAFVEWTTKAGWFDDRLLRSGDKTEEGGYRLARDLLNEKRPPEVIITFNESMAIGAYRAINEFGLSIPGDVGVASFNDISVAQFLNPPLTTVRLPAEEIGEAAGRRKGARQADHPGLEPGLARQHAGSRRKRRAVKISQ